jgi:hypothetical protein
MVVVVAEVYHEAGVFYLFSYLCVSYRSNCATAPCIFEQVCSYPKSCLRAQG